MSEKIEMPAFWPNRACQCPVSGDECKEAVAGRCDPRRCRLSLLYESPTSCVGCDEFLAVEFDVDHAMWFDGICLWAHDAIPHISYGHADCPRHKAVS